jgi:hypothetical protein
MVGRHIVVPALLLVRGKARLWVNYYAKYIVQRLSDGDWLRRIVIPSIVMDVNKPLFLG